MKVEIVAADESHVEPLSVNMRLADRRELAAVGSNPVKALRDGLAYSDPDMCWAMLIDGEPAIMWGAAPMFRHSLEVGIVWMLGSDALTRAPRAVWETSVEYVGRMSDRYTMLTNYVDDRNVVSARWLERLGFVAVGHCPDYGVEGVPFTQYAILRQPNV